MVRFFRIFRAILLLFLVLFIASQFVRPVRDNPPTRPGASLIHRTPADVAAILNRSCRDCHSNDTRWPWYTNVTPTNWLVANHVHHGRDHFNYSEWMAYDEDDQDKFLGGICSLTKRKRMPLPSYLLIHPEARLSEADINTLCSWSDKMRDMLQ